MYKKEKNKLHFDEEQAYEAVSMMENEDGTTGPHWSVEDTTSVANQYGINLNSTKFNKWDWFVAMNMIYSDFYKALANIVGNPTTRHFAELAKAWMNDKDIEPGKMWHYYKRIMSDCEEEEEEYEPQYEYIYDYEDEYEPVMSRRQPRYASHSYAPRSRRELSNRGAVYVVRK